MKNIDKHDLAVRLANLAYDYDYYDFIDSLNGDEDIETIILRNEKDLDNPKFIDSAIEWLYEITEEEDKYFIKRAKDLIADLKAFKRGMTEDMVMPRHSFVESPIFTKKWQDEHLTDDDLLALQSLIEKNLSNRTVCIPLGSNLYKVRFSPSKYNHGKNTSKRIYFIEIIKDSNIYLIHLLNKNEASNISPKQEEDFRELANKIN